MKLQKLEIAGIPALLWGQDAPRVYLYVHGKMGCKEVAESFAAIAERKGWQTLSFDLPEHGERKGRRERCDVFQGPKDVASIADEAYARFTKVALYACSIGAQFSLRALAQRPLTRCLLQSPIVDIAALSRQMMVWFGVTEQQLEKEKEIPTPVDPLRWDCFQYITTHPIERWSAPTHILYGGRDNLQTRDTMEDFARRFGCELTISEESEHPFMAETDAPIVQAWLEKNL